MKKIIKKINDWWNEDLFVIEIGGSIHQAEKMYSEEEVRAMIEKALTHNDYEFCGSLVTAQGEIRTANFGIWFEENKKK